MKLTKILRNGIAGTLIALVPVTSSYAATRPDAAVPMASSVATTATAAQDYDDDGGMNWVVLAAIGFAVAVALYIILKGDNDDDDLEGVSPG